MQRFLNLFLVVAIIIIIGLTFFFSRHIFFYQYEPEYQEGLYYYSQWGYPNSTRGISDGELYKFVGYRLAEGENPFYLNYETPPFGKYLYGLAEKYFGNPYIVSGIFYFFSIILLFFLAKALFPKEIRTHLLIILLLITTPFFATQVRETMLDLPLMFLFLTQTFLFIQYLSKPKILYLIGAGIFLGLATGTKMGVYTPFTMLIGLAFIIFTKNIEIPFNIKSISKKLWRFIFIIVYPGAVFGGYVLAFIQYFIKHHNPIPWVRLHEKSIEFYASPGYNTDPLKEWREIFLNAYNNWQSLNWQSFSGNSLVFPVGVIALIIIIIWAVKEKNKFWIYLTGLCSVFLIVNTFTFFPRYLTPTIPLFALLIARLPKKNLLLGFLILTNIPLLINNLDSYTPHGDAQAILRFTNTRAYREIYRSLTPQDRKEIPETEFIKTYENLLQTLNTDEIQTKIIELSMKSNSKAEGKYQISYFTKYGIITFQPTMEFQKINNQWKIKWNWNYLLSGFTPADKLVIEEKQDSILNCPTENGSIPIKRTFVKATYIIPRLMYDWNKYLGILSEITGDSTQLIDKRIRTVVPDDFPRFAGYAKSGLSPKQIEKYLAVPGVIFKDLYFYKPTSGDTKISRECRYLQGEIYLQNSKGEKTKILMDRN